MARESSGEMRAAEIVYKDLDDQGEQGGDIQEGVDV